MIPGIAKIVLADGTQGTAFPVSANLVFTAYHLVGDAKGDLRVSRLLLRFPSGQVEAEVDDWDTQLDIALLRINQLPAGCEPLMLADEATAGQSWVSTGYPVSVPGPVPIDGTIVSIDSEVPGQRGPALVLRCWQAAATSPQQLQGFSGAPVVADAPQRVLGVIRWQPTAVDDDRRAAVGGSVYATPTSAVRTRWPHRIAPLMTRSSRAAGQRRFAELLRTPPTPDGVCPRVADVDPFDIGVTFTSGSRCYPNVYIPRQEDERLRSVLAARPFALVVGPSGCGKSRTAHQAAISVLPGARFVQPKALPNVLRELLDLDDQDSICDDELLIWLDDLDSYLREDGGLDLSILGQLARRRPRAVVLATIGERQHGNLLTRGGELQATARAVFHRAGQGRVALTARNRLEESLYIYSVAWPDEPQTWQSMAALLAHHGRRAEAIEWLRRAASAGHLPSMKELGAILSNDEDHEEALYWYRMAAEAGDLETFSKYARELESRGMFEEAATWFRRAAEKGGPGTAFNVATFLERHKIGTAAEVVAWLKQAAESGDAYFMYQLAIRLYEVGELKDAESLLRRAIESGYYTAVWSLTSILWRQYSPDMSFDDCRRHADAGDVPSMLVMQALAKKHGDDTDAMHWRSKAMSAGRNWGDAILAEEELRREIAKYPDGRRVGARSLGTKPERNKDWWPSQCPPLWDE